LSVTRATLLDKSGNASTQWPLSASDTACLAASPAGGAAGAVLLETCAVAGTLIASAQKRRGRESGNLAIKNRKGRHREMSALEFISRA
jgi:hypothetical protein